MTDNFNISDIPESGSGPSVQLNWKFSTNTTIADPGSKNFRYDNSDPSLVTQIAVNDISNSGADASAILNALSAGDIIYIQQTTDAGDFDLFSVVTVTDNTGWFTLDVTVTDSGGLPSNNADCGWLLIFAAGGGGAVTSVFTRVGAVVAAASDYDASQIDNDSSVPGAFVDDALDNLDASIPPAAPVDSVFGRTGAVAAAASDYDAGQVDNDSSIAGAFVDDALNNLDNAVAQAQRTTDFAIPTAFGDVTLDTTNVETNAAIVNHDLGTNDDNIIAVVAGTYEVHYQLSIGPTQDTNSVSIVEARCRLNDTTVIAGSELHETVFNDTSLDSEDVIGFLSGTFVVALAATDFVTLQLNQIEQDGSPTPDALADTITLSMKRLTQ